MDKRKLYLFFAAIASIGAFFIYNQSQSPSTAQAKVTRKLTIVHGGTV
jgi:hypothetical protein